MDVILIIFAMSAGAAFVQRVSGFGFGIFIMSVLPFILPTYGESTALSGMLAAVTALFITVRLRRYILWRRLLPVLLTFLAVSALAVMVVSAAPEALLKRVLGVVLIVAGAWFCFFSGRVQVRPTPAVQVGLGSLSGLMGGLFGMQGPPAVLYFVSVTARKEEYMAMAQCYFLVGNLFMTLCRARAGFVTTAVLHGWLCGILGVVIGSLLGGIVYRHISLPILRRIIYIYLIVSGFVMLF